MLKDILYQGPLTSVLSSCTLSPSLALVSSNTWGSLLPKDLCPRYSPCLEHFYPHLAMADSLSFSLSANISFLERCSPPPGVDPHLPSLPVPLSCFVFFTCLLISETVFFIYYMSPHDNVSSLRAQAHFVRHCILSTWNSAWYIDIQ